MKEKTITAVALFIFFISNAQERNPFYIGHSLVNEDMPEMVKALATDAGKTTHYGKQIINGAPLSYNWDHHASAQGTSYQVAFPGGNYNTLVITEGIPLQNGLTWNNTYAKANDFYTYAKNNSNGIPIRFYIYETWHCKNSGIPQPDLPTGCDYDNSANSNTLWYPRLQADFPLWSGIVDYVRNQNPTDNEIWMVPAGQAFYNLTTQINAGNVPGITDVFDLFSDNIHMSNAGNYFVACVMYATIYRESPVGLTTNIANQWGTPFTNMPTPAQALIMQQVAWNTVVNLPDWTGVSTTIISGLDDFEAQTKKLNIYPNPATDFIMIGGKGDTETGNLQIYTSTGSFVKKATPNNEKISIADLPIGLYFIRVESDPTQIFKFLKEK